MRGYLGPAGIFSTGSPSSDEMQIMEERGPDDGLFEEEPVEEDLVDGICHECGFWEQEIFYIGDKKDLEDAKETLRKKHRAERPGCQATLHFG